MVSALEKRKLRRLIPIFAAMLFLTLPTCLFADETEEDLDDVLDAFGQETESVQIPPSEPPTETEPKSISSVKKYRFTGYFKTGSSFSFSHDAPETEETDWRGFSRLRSEFQGELTGDLAMKWRAFFSVKYAYDFIFGLRGRDEFTCQTLSGNESDLSIREAYLRGTLRDDLDIKIGRQIVVWGTSDNIRVTDVLNPMDFREPGLTDIEDLRLPVTMTRLDYFKGSFQLTGVAVHEFRSNDTPVFGSEFFPGSVPPPAEDPPSDGGSNTEFGLALTGVFSGWDLSFYYAHMFDDLPHMEKDKNQLIPSFTLKYSRINMVGAAFDIALGNFLIKSEGAFFDGLEFFNAPGKTFSRIDLLAGLEYKGFTDTTLSAEIAHRHIPNFDDRIENAPDEMRRNIFQSAIRVDQDYLNETLRLTILASTFGVFGEQGAFQRFSFRYEIGDGLNLSGGAVLYKSGELREFQSIGDNDRLFLEIRYDF